MIETFACRETERIFHGKPAKGLPHAMQRHAYRKLAMLHTAGKLSDLRRPPGNRLEKLKGDRAGQHSIRVNDQWRICFRWSAGGGGKAYDVAIVDYH